MEQDRKARDPEPDEGWGPAARGNDGAPPQAQVKGVRAADAAGAEEAWDAGVKGPAAPEVAVLAVGVRNQQEKEEIMPAGNGMGPLGMGPVTGRGMGFCPGVLTRMSMNRVPGQGFGLGFRHGRGFGGGHGCRNMFHATGLTGWQRAAAGWSMGGAVPPDAGPTKEQQLDALKGQAEACEGSLGELRRRIEELEAEQAAK